MKKSLVFLLLILFVELSWANVRRYRCVWNDDPATTMTIGFEQYDDSIFDSEGTPTLYFDTVNHGMDHTLYAFSQGSDRVVDHKGMENNFVRLKNLQPATRYYFMIKDDQGESGVMFFETGPSDPTERLSILAGGDSRDIPALDDDIGRQNANKLVAKLRTHGVLFGGDMTWGDDATHPLDVDEWPEWMDDWQLTIAADGRMTPIIAARGNHELDNNSVYHFFDTPHPEIYYALTLGGNLLRTVTLNSEISRLGNQLTWLEDELQNSCTTWKIAQYHRPTRPHESGKDEQNDQADYWSPLFEAHGVQLVLESDAHLCKYTYPIIRSDDSGNTEGFLRDDQNGVVYIGEGGWGAELRTVDDAKNWTMSHASFNQIKWLFIDQNNIEIRTVQTDNADAVIAKTDTDDLFTMPANISLWNPNPSDSGSGNMTYSEGVMFVNNPNSTEDCVCNPETCCEFPENIMVDLGTDPNRVNISWDVMPGAVEYQVRYRRALTTTWNNLAATTTTRTVQVLVQNKVYDYRVRSKCPDGTWSDMSPIDKFRTKRCIAPDNFMTTQLSNNKVRVEWSDYTYADKYQIFLRPAGSNDGWSSMVTYFVGMNYRVLNNLLPATTYEYKVRSWCEVSYGPFSDLHYFTNAPASREMEPSGIVVDVYPNPAYDEINVSYTIPEKSNIEISITDMNGRIVRVFEFNAEKGSHLKNVDIEELPMGYYILSIENNNVLESRKFVKM